MRCALLFGLALCACGQSPRPPTDGGNDGSSPDAGGSDGGTDAALDAGPRACADIVRAGPSFELDPLGPATEVQASAAFDGERIRLAFSRPDPMDTFDIWMTTVECDGTPGDPIRVSTTDANETDAEILVAASGSSFLVWSRDDGTGGTDNMHVFYRLLPDMDADAEIRTTLDGEIVPDNHISDTAVVDGDGFLVAGIRGLASTNRFHGFVQRLGADGSLDGEAWASSLNPELGYGTHALANAPLGAYVAFEREEEFVTRVWLGRVGDDPTATAAFPNLPIASAPSLTADLVDPSRVYLAVAGEVVAGSSDVWLTVASDASAEPPRLQLGAAGRFDGAPRLVAHPDGGGAVFYVQLVGTTYHLLAQRFAFDGTAFAATPAVEIASGFAPYPVAAVHVSGDIFFAAWSEGASPDYRLVGRFVELPPS